MPPLLKRAPRILLDSNEHETWASAFKFRAPVRNAIAALPLPSGNIVAIGATGTLSFVADLNPAVYTLRCHIGGRYRYETRGKTADCAANLFLAPGAHIRGSGKNANVVFVDIGVACVARAMGADPPQDFGLQVLPSQSGDMLRATALSAAEHADTITDDCTRGKFLRNFQNLMAAALAELLHEICPAIRRPDPMIGRRKVADLREWAALDHEDPLTVGDLAARCGLGLRALQKNFLRHFDTTPGEFLRGLRLEKARRLILSGAFTVTHAALEAGFVHLGHFSENYAQKFGELPSVTAGRSARVHA